MLALAVVAVLALADTFRLGFFGDDDLMLDAVRRSSPLEILAGHHGIWPWYRPLSRELFFCVLAGAGALAQPAARTLAIACTLASLWCVVGLGRRLEGERAAVLAALLWSASGITRFLTGWASGFQDLLVLLLILGALLAHASRRPGLALLLCGLAPFAKETGFLAPILVLAWELLVERRRPAPALLARLGAVGVLALGAHLAVRLSWHAPVQAPLPGPTGWAGLGEAAVEAARGLFAVGLPRDGAQALAGLAVAGLSAWLIARSTVNDSPRPRGAMPFLTVALGLSLLPFLLSGVAGLNLPRAHFLHGALPWLALLAGAALARVHWRWLVPALALFMALHHWALAYREPDLDAPSGWVVGTLGWEEAQRISARSARLGADLRELLAQRPESTVVLFDGLPSGSWFQTGDGPVARVVLGDPTLRAYHLSEAPVVLPWERVVVLAYDPVERHHLVRLPRDAALALRKAVLAILAEQPRAVGTWLAYGQLDQSRTVFAGFLGASAVLLERGPDAFVEALGARDLLDSLATGARPGREIPGIATPQVHDAFRAVLRSPRSAASHRALAQAFDEAGVQPLAALADRLALELRPDATAELTLARRFLRIHWLEPARGHLDAAARLGSSPDSIREIERLIQSSPARP